MFLQFSGPRYETDTKRSSSAERKFRTKFVGGNGSVVVRVIGRKFEEELQRRARDIDTRARSGVYALPRWMSHIRDVQRVVD